VSYKIEKIHTGLREPKSKKYRDLDRRLLSIVSNYNIKYDTNEYLRAISHCTHNFGI